MFDDNFILNTDSYKASHFLQYPPGTTRLSAYVESRGGRFPQTMFFGLQAFLKEYLTRPVTRAHIEQAADVWAKHGLPFNREGWETIVAEHGGFLPVEIEAVPEGTLVPMRNVMTQVVNTDPQLPWLTTYIETALLRGIWYPSTVATHSWACRRVIRRYLEETADTLDGLPFKLHDFGARGASSMETAALGGLAHLVCFRGTDTVPALIAARRWYHEDMAGVSIPAAEHSTMTVWGKDGEREAFAQMVQQFAKPGKLVSVVSDSYDVWRAIDEIWGEALRDQVRASGGTVVVRPDSGTPEKVVPDVLDRLMKHYGETTNRKGYRLLPDCIRVIQGDGVSLESIGRILEAMKRRRQSADNIVFGMGGELLQKHHRDTQKFAMKVSAAEISGRWQDVYKNPLTDPGKRSKRGRLALVRGKDSRRTIRREEAAVGENLLRPVFRNGEVLVDEPLSAIRARVDET